MSITTRPSKNQEAFSASHVVNPFVEMVSLPCQGTNHASNTENWIITKLLYKNN